MKAFPEPDDSDEPDPDPTDVNWPILSEDLAFGQWNEMPEGLPPFGRVEGPAEEWEWTLPMEATLDSSGDSDFVDREATWMIGIDPELGRSEWGGEPLEPKGNVTPEEPEGNEPHVDRWPESAVEQPEVPSERMPADAFEESMPDSSEQPRAEELEGDQPSAPEQPREERPDGDQPSAPELRRPEESEGLRPAAAEDLRAEAFERIWPDAFAGLRRDAEASFTVESWQAELDRQHETDELLERVDGLIGRVAGLPLVPERDGLVRRLERLSRSDVRQCLRLIGETLEGLAPDRAKVVVARDPMEWIKLLERSVHEVDELGAPTIVVLPAPDGRIDGRMPRSEMKEVEVLKSRGVMAGANATLTVLHRCQVERPVIEIAALIDSAEAGVSWEAWRCESSAGSGPGRAAADVRPRIVDCQAVSIGDNNTQHNVFEHRMSECPVNLGVLLADDDIREALVMCRDESLGDVERIQARERLRRIVTRVVRLTDASALIPDEAITRAASMATARPGVRSRGAALTVMHGMGVAIGWGTTVSSRTTTEVGRFQIR